MRPDLFMDGQGADRVAEAFYRKGVVAFERGMQADWLARARTYTMTCMETCLAAGAEATPGLVVQRSPGRFDIRFAAGSLADVEPPTMDAEDILAAVGAILGRDWRFELRGAVVALPGAGEMPWHVDGAHLFPELPVHLPAHALNVFVPLVDITDELGPTEFCPGSHFLTRDTRPSYVESNVPPERLGYTDRPVPAAVPAGAVVLADFRTLHRALPNRSGRPRPLAYFSCARPWFRDGAF